MKMFVIRNFCKEISHLKLKILSSSVKIANYRDFKCIFAE